MAYRSVVPRLSWVVHAVSAMCYVCRSVAAARELNRCSELPCMRAVDRKRQEKGSARRCYLEIPNSTGGFLMLKGADLQKEVLQRSSEVRDVWLSLLVPWDGDEASAVTPAPDLVILR
jgi:hypothetical protein